MAGLKKEEAEKLMESPGKVRGIALKNHGQYIESRWGKEALKAIEKRIRETGQDFSFDKVSSMNFYPVGLEALLFVVSKEEVGFDEKEFMEVGSFGSKLSLIIKLFAKYFVSVKKLVKKAPEIWRKYYTTGDLEVASLDEKEGRAVLRLKNFNLHPYHCLHVAGYVRNVLRMALGRPVEVEETRCTFRGDPYHEFVLSWKP